MCVINAVGECIVSSLFSLLVCNIIISSLLCHEVSQYSYLFAYTVDWVVDTDDHC